MSIIYLRTPTSCPESLTYSNLSKSPKPKKKFRRPEPSNGEKFISQCLDDLKLSYTTEFSLPTLPKLRYDFILKDHKIIIEYDSELHFKFCKYIHKNQLKFWKSKERDKLKTSEAVRVGYLIIRIDYTYYGKFEEVRDLIQKELLEFKGVGKFVCLNQELYRYLSEPINPRILKKYLK